MAILTVRNLPEEIHRAIKTQAALHGRSTEAEIRDILTQAVNPEGRILMGDAMVNLGRELALTDEDVNALEQNIKQTPAEPMSFE